MTQEEDHIRLVNVFHCLVAGLVASLPAYLKTLFGRHWMIRARH